MRRGRSRHPNLRLRRLAIIGWLTLAIVALIGYVAYRANYGLPLQQRYTIQALVPDADRLIPTADVRIGGVLVGEVTKVTAEPARPGGKPYARLTLAMNSSVRRIPMDSRVQVRPASVLGLTYVNITLGRGEQSLPHGATLGLTDAQPSSDLTDLFDIFNQRASAGFQKAMTGMAYGLAGRGTQLNLAIAQTVRLLGPLQRVSATLAARATQLASFVSNYDRFFGALSPDSSALGDLVVNGSSTFASLEQARPELAGTIDAAGPAERATTATFTRIQPALEGLARLMSELRPTGAVLPSTLAQLNPTLVAGDRPLADLPSFSRPLGQALAALQTTAQDPDTVNSLRKLHDLLVPTNRALSVMGPAQETCNALSIYGQSFSSVFGAIGSVHQSGLALMFLTGIGSLFEQLQNARPGPDLHANPLPVESSTRCEGNNEPYTPAQALGSPKGPVPAQTRVTVPPPGVRALAQKAGLLQPIPGM